MTFVRTTWYFAMWSHEVTSSPVHRTICGDDVAFWRTSSGELRAVDAVCPHRGANLADGVVVGDRLQCPFHGWQFATDGRCVRIPSQPPELKIPAGACVRTYDVAERQGAVWIWMGASPPEVDPPHIPSLVDDSVVLRSEARLLDAEFVNVVENAFDESHLAFLHQRTLGVATPLVPRQIVEVADDRRSIVCRWDPDSPWGDELFASQDHPKQALGRWLVGRFGRTRHAERRWGYAMAGVVWFHEPLDGGGLTGAFGAATPMDEHRTWFSTALIHPVVAGPVPNALIRLWGRMLDAEDRQGTVGLLRPASRMPSPQSAVADRGPNQFRRLHREWLAAEVASEPRTDGALDRAR